jgi:hypothetical protein
MPTPYHRGISVYGVRYDEAMKQMDFKVVGLTFVPSYPDNLMRVDTLVTEAQKASLGWSSESQVSQEVGVLLVRNPANEHDENAVEVHVPSLGRSESMIGHVPRDLAERLAPSLDRGDRWSAHVGAVLVTPEHPDRPGVEVIIERQSVATGE